MCVFVVPLSIRWLEGFGGLFYSIVFLEHLKFQLRVVGGAVVLGKLPVPGRPVNLDYRRSRASALAAGAG